MGIPQSQPVDMARLSSGGACWLYLRARASLVSRRNGGGELLYPAPLNAIRPPHGSKRGFSGRSRPVLARLVWPRGLIVVAARLA